MKSLINQLFKKFNGSDRKLNSENITQSSFSSKTGKAKWIMGSGIAFFLIIIIFLIQHQSATVSHLAINENAQTQTILNQLNDINSQLQQLSSSPQNSSTFQQALASMSNDLSVIEKTVNNLASRP